MDLAETYICNADVLYTTVIILLNIRPTHEILKVPQYQCHSWQVVRWRDGETEGRMERRQYQLSKLVNDGNMMDRYVYPFTAPRNF